MHAIILAGGFGTRLRSRVADRPKALAPVAGRPFLEYLLDWLEAGGCRQVTLATGHLSQMLEAHFGGRYRGVAIGYSREASPLGTGGAIAQAMAQLPPDSPALVMNGDTWLGLDLPAFVSWCSRSPHSDAIALRSVPDTSRYASVSMQDEHITAFGAPSVPGPGLINAGIYWLRGRTLARFDMPPAFSIENDFFRVHAPVLGLRGFVTEGQFIDIGVPQDYDRAQVELPRWIAGR